MGDAEKRKEYDETRRLGASGLGGFGGGFPGGFGGPGQHHLPGGGPRRPGRPLRGARWFRRRAPHRPQRRRAAVPISRPSCTSRSKTACAVSRRRCTWRARDGARPARAAEPRPAPSPSPARSATAGACSRTTRDCSHCPRCARVVPGAARWWRRPCPTCHGTGVTKRTREVKVRIPAGVENGQRIRVKGRGAPGQNNGPSGDLYVNVRVAPHALFGRRGRNLTLDGAGHLRRGGARDRRSRCRRSTSP